MGMVSSCMALFFCSDDFVTAQYTFYHNKTCFCHIESDLIEILHTLFLLVKNQFQIYSEFTFAGRRVHGHVWNDGRNDGKRGEHHADFNYFRNKTCLQIIHPCLKSVFLSVVFVSRKEWLVHQTVRHFPLRQWSLTPLRALVLLKFISRPVKPQQALEGWEYQLINLLQFLI